jgi:hypothetical protein
MRALLIVIAMVAFAPWASAEPQPTETRIEAHGPSGILRGTLLTAADPTSPVILIIPGSGPTDRDGNSPMGINASPYRLLAEALAPLGVSTVRIDKRGLFQSAAPGLDPNAVTIPDYANDVRAWTAEIKARLGVHCVWVAGHSEGALVAEAAVQSDRNACGVILIAGVGQRPGEELRRQILANPANAPLIDASNHIITDLEAGHRVDVSATSGAVPSSSAGISHQRVFLRSSAIVAELLGARSRHARLIRPAGHHA